MGGTYPGLSGKRAHESRPWPTATRVARGWCRGRQEKGRDRIQGKVRPAGRTQGRKPRLCRVWCPLPERGPWLDGPCGCSAGRGMKGTRPDSHGASVRVARPRCAARGTGFSGCRGSWPGGRAGSTGVFDGEVGGQRSARDATRGKTVHQPGSGWRVRPRRPFPVCLSRIASWSALL